MQSLQADPDHRAHLELTSVDTADQWLYALPSAALYNKVEPALFKTMVQFCYNYSVVELCCCQLVIAKTYFWTNCI